MSTATPSPARRKGATTAAPPREHSEWRFGPVGGAVAVAIWSLLTVEVGRLAHAHIQPVWALVGGFAIAVTLLFAGRMRTVQVGMQQQSRPLAVRSLVFRFTAASTTGVWLWVQLADFSAVNGAGVLSALAVLGGVLVMAGVTIALVKAGMLKLAVPLAVPTLAGLFYGAMRLFESTGLAIFLVTEPLTLDSDMSWLWPACGSLALMVVVFAIMGAACANHERAEDAARMRFMLAKSGSADRAALQAMLREHARAPQLVVTAGPTRWPNGAGENYTIDGSADGLSAQDLSAVHVKNSLASKLKLPPGCGVEAVIGSNRGETIMGISRIDKIKEDHLYPMTEIKQRSIYNPIPLGVLRDAVEAGVSLRENSLLLWGQKRSGKTTSLYDLITGLAQCTDAMIWVIDLGGGGAAIPFMYAAAEGRVDRPVIDWIATTLEETALMAECAYQIAITRKKVYQYRKRLAADNLLPLDAEVPEIVIVIDEGKMIMGEGVTKREDGYAAGLIRDRLEQVVDVAGDSGVNMVLSVLRATSDAVDPGVLAQMGCRVGMRVSDTKELAYGFGDWSLNPDDAPYKGSGFIVPENGASPRVFKAFQITPPMIDEVAVITAPWRPFLDDKSRAAAGMAYAKRWERTWSLICDDKGDPILTSAPNWDIAPTGSTAGQAQVAPAATAVAVMDPPAPPTGGPGSQPPPPPGPQASYGPPPGTPPALPYNPGPAGTPPVPPQPVQPPRPPTGGDGQPPAAPGDDRPTREELHAGVDFSKALQPPGEFDLTSPEELLKQTDSLLNGIGFAGTGDAEFDQVINGGWTAPNPDLAGPGTVEVPKPAHLEEAENPGGRAVLAEILRQAGPGGLQMKDICTRLTTGGPWGPKVEVARQTVDTWLKEGIPTEEGGACIDPARALYRKVKRGWYAHRTPVQGN